MKNIIRYLFLLLAFFIIAFYLRQQITIVKLQYRIQSFSDEIELMKSKNKELIKEIEELKSYKRLEEHAKKLGFIKPSPQDVIYAEDNSVYR